MLITHIVSPQEDGMTLHALMRGPMALSGRQTRIVKQEGAVTVDAAPFFSNQPVRTGMIVRIELPDYEDETAPARDLNAVRVLYEDDTLLAVFKPAPLQCHPSPSAPRGSDTLESRVQRYLGRSAHPVHRLDAETTGVVLFAKVPFVQAHLQQQMANGRIAKRYQAWAYSVPSPESGEIDAPIARMTPDSFTRVVREDGQRAVSRYSVVRTAPLPGGHCASLLDLSPVTGRTHQLRVHMTHIGCPLLGDTRYFTPASFSVSAALGLPHHQLSAVSIRFIHPVSGKEIAVACDPVFSPQLSTL